MRQDHLEHVSLELLHDHKDALGRLEHALEIDDARVRQVLQDGHLVLELRLLLGREAQLVYHLGRQTVETGKTCGAYTLQYIHAHTHTHTHNTLLKLRDLPNRSIGWF